MKYKNRAKNTVQETLILPAVFPGSCAQSCIRTFTGTKTAVRLIDQIDYDVFRSRGKLPQPDAAVRCAGGRHAAE